MTKEEIRELRSWIDSLTGDQRTGALEALGTILNARASAGEGGKIMLPPEIEVDPDLLQPEVPADAPTPPDDVEFDDPEDLLSKKDKSTDSEETTDDSEDTVDSSDEESEKSSKDEENSDDVSADTEDSDLPELDEPEDIDSDGEDKPDDEDADEYDEDSDESEEDSDEPEEDSDESSESEEEEDEEEDEKVEDEIEELPDELTKDKEAEDLKSREIFRRKVEVSTLKKQIKRAKIKIDKGEVTATPEQIKELEEYEAELERILKELKDNPDSVKDTSAKEFNDFINKVLDAVDALGVRHIKVTDMDARIKKILDDNEDEFAADAMNDEDKANIQKDPEFQKMKAREREKERIRQAAEREVPSVIGGDIEAFKRDLKKAIGNQIGQMIEVEEETYARFNRWHEEDDLALPGIRIDEIPEQNKPSVDVYIDQSGSWTDEDVERAMTAIAELIKLEDEKLLKLDIYYFSAILSQEAEAARRRGEYECWDLIIQNINAAPKAKNVIMVTDTDIAHDWRVPGCHGCIKGPGTSVEGCVWFLWKNGRRVTAAHNKLFGRKGTFEYSI